MSDAQQPHILPDETLDYIADEELSNSRPKDAAFAAMKRVRAQYEKVFYWNEARLFRRIAELEAKLAESQPAAQPSTPLAEIVAQLRLCNYECEAGSLHDNAAWRELERMAQQQGDVVQPDQVVQDAAEAQLRSITFSDDASNGDRYYRGFNDGYDFALSQQRGVPQVDWSQAPDWANYWAMDSNGTAYWHETKPVWSEVAGVWRSKWRSARNYRLNPSTTLQQRPTEQGGDQ